MHIRDPLDDLLSTGTDDLADTLRGIHVRYGSAPAPPAGLELSTFTSPEPVLDGAPRSLPIAETALSTSTTPEPQGLRALVQARSRRTMRVITAFIATVTGKVVLGSAVAAASLTGAQLGGVIDVLPGPTKTIVILEDLADTEGDQSDPDAAPVDPSNDDAGVDDRNDGATENTDDGPSDDSDDRAADDSAVDDSDDGAVDDSDDGAVGDVDDGKLDDADDGDQDDLDDAEVDDGETEDATEGNGAIDDADDVQVGETAD